MKKIQIEKNVPLPSKRNTYAFPFQQMEVGDSFYTEVRTVQQCSAYYAMRHNVKFSCRKQGKGMRCWRVK